MKRIGGFGVVGLVWVLVACGGGDSQEPQGFSADRVESAILTAIQENDVNPLRELTCENDRPPEGENPLNRIPDGTSVQVECQQEADIMTCNLTLTEADGTAQTQVLTPYVVNDQLCSIRADQLSPDLVEQAILAGTQGDPNPARAITCPAEQPEEGQTIEVPPNSQVAVNCQRQANTMICDLSLQAQGQQGAVRVAFAIVEEKLCGEVPVPLP